MKKHVQLIVKGKVQGVWYRASTQQKAQELGLTGFVRNEPNGDVYIEVEGDEQTLTSFLKWCWEGPELAQVLSITQTTGDNKGFKSFDIVRG